MNGNVPTSLITLMGVTRNTDNYGVRVLMSGAVEVLSDLYPNAELALLDYGREAFRWTETTKGGRREIVLINLRFSWKVFLSNNLFRLLCWVALTRYLPRRLRESLWQRNPWLRRILEAQWHYSLAGGDSFSDIYGLGRFLYVTLPQILVLLMGRPLVLLPQTYGPFRGPITRMLARFILRRSHTLFCREAEGIGVVQLLLRDANRVVRIVPDLGFVMSPAPLPEDVQKQLAEIKQQGPLVGLNISGLLYGAKYNAKNTFRLREPFDRLVKQLMEFIVNDLKARVLLVPHVCGGTRSQEDETRLCNRLANAYADGKGKRVYYIDYVLDHRQIKTLISFCDIFVGARMHACIGAASQAVPTVCLAYSHKFGGVMRPLEPGVQVVDLRIVSASGVFRTIKNVFDHQAELRENLQALLPGIVQRIGFSINSALRVEADGKVTK